MARRHQAGPQQLLHPDLENLQDGKAQRLRGRSKVIVRIWTFRGAEKQKDSESEGGEKRGDSVHLSWPHSAARTESEILPSSPLKWKLFHLTGRLKTNLFQTD